MTDLVALSLGAGVQSTTLTLLAIDGTLPRPDVAIFSDTGWEPRRVYEHLARLEQAAAAAGIEVVRVDNGNIRRDHLDPVAPFSSMPLFVRTGDGGIAMGRRQCTHDYKLRPIWKELRRRLGAPAPDHKRVPRGRVAELWIGFSRDEIGRVGGNRRNYIRHRHPLLELGWTRTDCLDYLRSQGWGETPKSSCIGCPFHGNRAWRDLRDNRPDEWADAVEFDRAIREAPKGSRSSIRGEQYLHRSGLPLDEADLRSAGQLAADRGQGALFDVDEEGDPDGCGPFACRSGTPVA